jgi:hypothetical protein
LCSVPTDSRIFRNKLGSSCQRSYWSCLNPWGIICRRT